MKLKRFSLRFNLDRENDRRAWEALHRMDARSINQEIIARINAKEQTDVLKELIRQTVSEELERTAKNSRDRPAAQAEASAVQHRAVALHRGLEDGTGEEIHLPGMPVRVVHDAAHGVVKEILALLIIGGCHSMSEKALCEVNMTYATMRSYFRAAERARQHLSGFIVFSPASFNKEYSVESRTYAVSSDNKAFRPNMGGYSIYASSLDGSDPCVRLEQYMASEYGGKNGWQIERCYMMSDEVERAKALMRTEKEHER